VPRVIRGYREAFPLESLTLEESLTNDLPGRLRGSRIDAAFLGSPVADREGLVITPLLDAPTVLALFVT
jgi:DNA-binding transcriptional LysR family regulator